MFDSDNYYWLFFLATVEMITSMSPTLLSTLALLFVSFAHNANAGFRMELNVLLTARMDPLVSPNGIAAVSFIYFNSFVTPPLTVTVFSYY